MKKRARTRKREPLVPAITVPFEEAVSRLLKVKPAPRGQRRAMKIVKKSG